MPIAYPITSKLTQVFLSKQEIASLLYHDIFEYPLSMPELIKWTAGMKNVPFKQKVLDIRTKNGFFFLGGKETGILKRYMRKRISARKIGIAKKAAQILSFIPSVKMVAITGALSMENATDGADIDLLVITKEGTLWTSRFLSYLLLRLSGISVRSPKNKLQKDKLCLNMWMDESDLAWTKNKRNIYTAHEIAQIKPILNREKVYEKFILRNVWVREYWPNALPNKLFRTKISGIKRKTSPNFFNEISFKFQYQYMKSRITNETITKTRAFFHPVDWGRYILQKLAP